MTSHSAVRLLLTHFFVTSALTGLIWTIQIVHYPLFAQVGDRGFVSYQQAHSWRISTLVGPLMGIELLCALWIAFSPPAGVTPTIAWVGFALLVVVHIGTIAFAVPAHTALGNGFNAVVHQRLVRTNWIRTAGWSLRAGLAAYMLTSVFQLHLQRR